MNMFNGTKQIALRDLKAGDITVERGVVESVTLVPWASYADQPAIVRFRDGSQFQGKAFATLTTVLGGGWS